MSSATSMPGVFRSTMMSRTFSDAAKPQAASEEVTSFTAIPSTCAVPVILFAKKKSSQTRRQDMAVRL